MQARPEQQRPDLAAYGYVPEPAELALIKAALRLDPLSPPALALAQLAAAGRTDRGVIRLLPLLRRRPELPPALREKVEQLYRASLVRFMELEEQLRQVTLTLQRHEITPLLLKGYPLWPSYYYANPPFGRPVTLTWRCGRSAFPRLCRCSGRRALRLRQAPLWPGTLARTREPRPPEVRSICTTTSWSARGGYDGTWVTA